jgi:transposase-like protein
MAQGTIGDRDKEAFWRKMVREQKRSGVSIRAFCRERGAPESAFYFWRRELERRQAKRTTATAFVPVRVTEDAAAPAGGRIEIVLGRGRRVQVAGPVDRQALADVVAVLEADAC